MKWVQHERKLFHWVSDIILIKVRHGIPCVRILFTCYANVIVNNCSTLSLVLLDKKPILLGAVTLKQFHI